MMLTLSLLTLSSYPAGVCGSVVDVCLARPWNISLAPQ